MIAFVIKRVHWTWDYCEETLTYPRYLAIMREYKYPSLEDAVPAYIGYKPIELPSEVEKKRKKQTQGSFQDFLRDGGFIQADAPKPEIKSYQPTIQDVPVSVNSKTTNPINI